MIISYLRIRTYFDHKLVLVGTLVNFPRNFLKCEEKLNNRYILYI